MTRHSSKSNKFREVNTVRGRTGNAPVQKRKIYYVKIKVLSLILDETNPFEIDKCKSKNGASVSDALHFLMYFRWINTTHHAFKVGKVPNQ